MKQHIILHPFLLALLESIQQCIRSSSYHSNAEIKEML